jgi:hypothetical protein
MDGSISSPYDRMLASLRGTFNRRLPGGLSDTADKRLQRTLDHYIKQVVRVQGTINEREILRESFDSMAGWFRRNTAALGGSPVPVTSVAPSPTLPAVMTAVSTEPPLTMNEEEDPIALFERLKAARAGIATVAPPLPSQPLMELTAVETRPRPPVVGVPASFTSTPLDAIFPPSQSKDILQRQDDVVKYRESEYNIVLNSKDRNWFLNRTENRYNFTVQLNGGATPQGRGYQATLMNRLKNIVRLEFIKAILPVEGLEVVVPRLCDASSSTVPVPEVGFVSVLSNPFIQVLLDEQTGNNIGTNDIVDRSLAICQYDATWKSDQTHDPTHSRGYTLFFPKFMKAQRIFAPTPLASLQNLHFQLINPEGLPVSCLPDSLNVAHIVYSNAIDVSGTCYYDLGATGDTAQYLFLQTADYFPLWSFSKYDRVTFAGLTKPTSVSDTPAFDALATWLSRPAGHIVVGIAHGSLTGTAGAIQMDGNNCGYANWVVIRNAFAEPDAAGTCTRSLFASTNALENTFAGQLNGTGATVPTGALLNLSRQVQLFLRVVTREVDSGTNVRPDNI